MEQHIRAGDDVALLNDLVNIFKADGATEKAALSSVHKLVDKLGRAVVQRLSSSSSSSSSSSTSSSTTSTPVVVVAAPPPAAAAAAANPAVVVSASPARCTVDTVSCIQPRGKFSLVLGERELRLSGKTELSSDWSNVRCIVRFPKPDPYKTDKAGNNQFLLVAFKRGVPHGPKGAPMHAVVAQADGKKTMDLTLASLAGVPSELATHHVGTPPSPSS